VRLSGGTSCLAVWLSGCLAVWLSGCLDVWMCTTCHVCWSLCWSVTSTHHVLGTARRTRVVLHRTVIAADKPVANRIGICRCIYIVPTPGGGCGNGGVRETCERSVFERGPS
jgi:Fe-S oxidoreductase